MVRYAKCLKEGIELLISPPLVGLDSNNFAIKLAFYKCLKIFEHLKNVGSFLEEINPRKFAVVINEANIICVSTH